MVNLRNFVLVQCFKNAKNNIFEDSIVIGMLIINVLSIIICVLLYNTMEFVQLRRLYRSEQIPK